MQHTQQHLFARSNIRVHAATRLYARSNTCVHAATLSCLQQHVCACSTRHSHVGSGVEGGAKILQNVTRFVLLRLQMLSTTTMDVHAVQSEYQLHEEQRKKPVANAIVIGYVASAAFIGDSNIRAGGDGSSCGIHVSLQHTRGT